MYHYRCNTCSYVYNSCSRYLDTNRKESYLFLGRNCPEANTRRGSWKLNVESEATAKCREFGLENPQRVLLYNKPGLNGAELMLVVLSPVCQVAGDS